MSNLGFAKFKTVIKEMLITLAPYSVDEIKTHFSGLKTS